MVNDLIRLVALTAKDETLYPVRAKLRDKLAELELQPSTPFEPLKPGEPTSVTFAVNHILAFIEKTVLPGWLPKDTNETAKAKMAERCDLLQKLAASINLDVLDKDKESVMVFEPTVKSSPLGVEPAVEPEAEPAANIVDTFALQARVANRLKEILDENDVDATSVDEVRKFIESANVDDMKGIGKASLEKVRAAVK